MLVARLARQTLIKQILQERGEHHHNLLTGNNVTFVTTPTSDFLIRMRKLIKKMEFIMAL